MPIITNFHTLKALHTEAMSRGTGSKQWIEFASVMADSFPALFETAKQMNEQLAASVQSKAAVDVLAEHRRQIEAEGWTPKHDDEEHADGELAGAAACYAGHVNARGWVVGLPTCDYQSEPPPSAWPWHSEWWKPTSPRRDLVKAAALILAEIERLDRTEKSQPGVEHEHE